MCQRMEETAVLSSRKDPRDINTYLSGTNRPSRQEISKDAFDPNGIINPLDLNDVYKTLHPTTPENSAVHMDRSPRDTREQVLDQRTHPNQFKRTEIMQSMFLDHRETEPEINNRRRAGKSPRVWRLNNMLLCNT